MKGKWSFASCEHYNTMQFHFLTPTNERQTTPSSLHRGHLPGVALRAQAAKYHINSHRP
jgi:hypothetical protein